MRVEAVVEVVEYHRREGRRRRRKGIHFSTIYVLGCRYHENTTATAAAISQFNIGNGSREKH
jgi:hypothetical protein